MSLHLKENKDTLKKQFDALATPEDIAALLGVRYSDLVYWIYRTPTNRRYSQFTICKKHGSDRVIASPSTNVKILQQKLHQVLQAVYRPKISVHGFMIDRSVITNAEKHLRRRYVFNADLQDFFPSINFGRVRGMFMGRPYNRPERVATVLAHLCCYNRTLPQGAPTSPDISNMICARMDSQLQQLATVHRCTYTRYVDDITFSTSCRALPSAIAVENDMLQVEPGTEFSNIVTSNGFAIHPAKVWFRRQDRRQEVTGIIVNQRLSLPRRYTNQIRAMLHAWETHGLVAAQVEYDAKYSCKHRAPWRKPTLYQLILKGKIEYLGMVKGKSSPMYIKFLRQLRKLDSALVTRPLSDLETLIVRYEALENSDEPHNRGYALQELLRETFNQFGVSMTKPFTRNKGAEQIDGGFRLDGWYYIVECRWRKKIADGRELDGLNGQVGRSGKQTMGVFLSINGWTDHVPKLLKQNSSKSIILVSGEDFKAVLLGDLTLEEMISRKLDALNQYCEPFRSVEDIMKAK